MPTHSHVAKTDLKLCILDADHLYPPLRQQYQSYGCMFEQLFAPAAQALGFDLDITRFDVVAGEYPNDPKQFDGCLITGSKADAFADDLWIVRLRDFVSGLLAQQLPIAGICFGHQLLALLLGGDVARAERGWGVGLMSYDMAPAADWPASLTALVAEMGETPLRLLASHQDQVQWLPDGVTVLAGNAFCPIAAFCLDNRVLAFQAHPEFSAAYLQALMTIRRERVGESNYQKALQAMDVGHDGALVGQWLLLFMRAASHGSL